MHMLDDNSLGQLIVHGLSIFRANVLVAPSETVSLMLMRQYCKQRFSYILKPVESDEAVSRKDLANDAK